MGDGLVGVGVGAVLTLGISGAVEVVELMAAVSSLALFAETVGGLLDRTVGLGSLTIEGGGVAVVLESFEKARIDVVKR